MCLAFPGRIEWIGKASTSSIPGIVSYGEQTRDVDLVMVPDARVEDHVIIHSGYAIRIVGAEEVARIFDIVHLP
jgi:hydrogenase expression/formation protein HypC